MRLITPAGELRTLDTPHTAAGPALRELIVGSEGVFGVIPDVTVRVRPAPAVAPLRGLDRRVLRGRRRDRPRARPGPGLPDVIRVSDEEETEVSLALSGPRGAGRRLFGGYLGLRRRRGGCLIIVGYEGDRGVGGAPPGAGGARAARRRRRLPRPGRGRGWEHGRYQGPYLRDTLMDHGGDGRDARDLAHLARLAELYAAVGGAIRNSLAAQGTPGLVFCHLSHAYADGASLYFTFISAPARARSRAWRG